MACRDCLRANEKKKKKILRILKVIISGICSKDNLRCGVNLKSPQTRSISEL